jgi:hypothetical protein
MGAAGGGGSGCEDCEGIGTLSPKRFFAGFFEGAVGLHRRSIKPSTEITRAEDLRTFVVVKKCVRNVSLGRTMPGEMLEEHRAALSAIQCVSQDFRGFTESQLDELLPFLDFIDFSEGQEIVTQGEDASWFGLLLGGQLEVRHGSHVLATLTPGRIVGEMAFFRGGKRGASMIGISAGTLAVAAPGGAAITSGQGVSDNAELVATYVIGLNCPDVK